MGDVLLELDGARPRNLDEVRALVARLPVAVPSTLIVQRAAQCLELRAQAEPLPLEALGMGQVVLDEVPWRTHRLRAVWTFPDTARSGTGSLAAAGRGVALGGAPHRAAQRTAGAGARLHACRLCNPASGAQRAGRQ